MLPRPRRVALLGAVLSTLASPVGLLAQTEAGSATRPTSRDAAKQTPKPGIAVIEPLIEERCVSCHKQDERGMMSRISYMRKSPEGWSTSIKRMIRLYGVSMTPSEAKQMVRYLASDHGLTRSEAERSLYESERRVHWSEEHHDEDLKRACSMCHTLGRVLANQRDADEWKLLRATHLAYFPLSSRQVGGQPRRPSRGSSARGSGSGDSSRSRSSRGRGDRGDRVLDKLAKEQPLFSDEWKAWEINRREVPLNGRWTVTGHEVGRGDVTGQVVMKRVEEDAYETHWMLEFSNGDKIERAGRGLLYAGYSWRGSSSENDTKWREVLLLDEEWRRFKGRVFTGEYSEIGLDVELHRQTGEAQVFAIRNRAVMIPSRNHVLDVVGEGFSDSMSAADFHLGRNIDVNAFEFVSPTHVRLTIDVDRKTERGERMLTFGLFRGSAGIVLYDTVDYITITPLQGLARIGGVASPKQYERFEAIAMNRGPDDKSYTEDDYEIMFVPGAKWSLAEFRVRENDDDLQFVGKIDADTGFFVPAIDGPNPKRRWQANNVGDVYVVCEAELMVQRLPEKPKPKAKKKPDAVGKGGRRAAVASANRGGDSAERRRRWRTRAPEATPRETPSATPKPAVVEDAAPPVVMIKKRFKARAHLVVTVPKYQRFEVLDWKDE